MSRQSQLSQGARVAAVRSRERLATQAAISTRGRRVLVIDLSGRQSLCGPSAGFVATRIVTMFPALAAPFRWKCHGLQPQSEAGGENLSQHRSIAVASRPSGVAVDMRYRSVAAAAPPSIGLLATGNALFKATSPTKSPHARSVIFSRTRRPRGSSARTRNRVPAMQELKVAMLPEPPPRKGLMTTNMAAPTIATTADTPRQPTSAIISARTTDNNAPCLESTCRV